VLLGLAAAAPAQPPAAGTGAHPEAHAAAAAGSELAPVPVPEPSEKALRYHRGNNILWAVNTLWGWLVPAAILFSGLSARMRNLARRIGRRWYFTLVAYFVLYSLLTFVVDLPLAYYEGFVREHAYGLSNQTLAKWSSDAVKALMVGLVAGALFLWIPYLLLRRSPGRWWLYTSLAAVPVFVLVVFVTPLWIEPLFNEFGPMRDKALEARILALAERAGIEGSRVYEVAKSVDTRTVNAYVTGFMGTKRIVLWDTLIARLEPDEVLFVMGHEMGHYVLGHVVRSIVFFSFVTLVTLYAAHRLSRGLLARFSRRFGFDTLADPASLPLLLLLASLFGFVVTPGVLAYSRWQEHEADRFGLELTQDNRAAAMAFVKLQQENLAVPRPGWIVRVWRASHPVLGDRIDFCNTYHPWREGRPLKYGALFK
jgi:Zn-dependent protease with chaperone function